MAFVELVAKHIQYTTYTYKIYNNYSSAFYAQFLITKKIRE